MMVRRVLGVVAAVLVAAGCSSCASDRGSTPFDGTGMTAASSTDVSFTVDGTRTYGTLEVPAHRTGRRLAAALLLAGSGPTDRDGNDAGADLHAGTLKLIAGVLADHGIASLRFDKYFSGRTGAGAYKSDPSKVVLSTFVRQADAAYDLLRSQTVVDENKLLLVGHSEGGKYALLVAESVTRPPAGIALIEPSSLRLLDNRRIQLVEKLNAEVSSGAISASVAQTNEQLIQQAIDDFRAGRTVSLAGLLPAVASSLQPTLLGNNVDYARSVDPVVPAELAAKVRSGTRVLVTDGTRDTNIPPSTIGPLVDALKSAGTTGPGYVVLQGTDHLLHLADQGKNDQVLAPDAIAAIARWAQSFAA